MTVSILRPDGTVTNSGVQLSSGTLHGILSDNSDATYAFDVDSGNIGTVSLGDFTLPAGAVIKRVALRVRLANFDDD